MIKDARDASDWTFDFFGIKALHDKGWRGQGLKVAILDTGWGWKHPDLYGTEWVVEDVRGYDDPYDRNYHSTWIHGRFAAKHNGRGVKGISPDIKVGIFKCLDDDGTGETSWIAKGIYRAHETGHDAINMSIGMDLWDEEIAEAIRYVTNQGVIVGSVAGNDGKNNDTDFPGRMEETLTFGSIDRRGKKSDFSDTGLEDCYFGGEDVISTWGNDSYAYLKGTSMSLPGGLAQLMCMKNAWEAATNEKLSVWNVNKLATPIQLIK